MPTGDLPAQGYIKLYRRFFDDDPFWNQDRERSRAEAWIDMIQMAAWKPHFAFVGNDRVELARGQFLASRRFLAQRWKWTEKQVRCLVEVLTKKGQLRAERETPSGHVYLVVNYETYQGEGPGKGQSEFTEGPGKGQARARQGPKEEERKKQEEAGEEEKRTNGTLFESSAPPPSASAAEPGDPVEIWVPFEGKEPPMKAKHGPWRAGTNGAHWEYGVTASLLASLKSLYPGVEVENAARQFADWCYRNPPKRKTYSGGKCGVLESLHFWLNKRQNEGSGARANASGNGTYHPAGRPIVVGGLDHSLLGAPDDLEQHERELRESDLRTRHGARVEAGLEPR